MGRGKLNNRKNAKKKGVKGKQGNKKPFFRS